MQPRLCLTAIAILLAGCLAPAQEGDRPPSPESPLETSPVWTWNSSVKEGPVIVTPIGYTWGLLQGNEKFAMPNATKAWLNITLEGSLPADIRVRYIPPGCPDISCRRDVHTRDQRAALEVDAPVPGEWEMVFFAEDRVTPSHGTYRLEITVLNPRDV